MSISVTTILQYYAILCLGLLPVGLVMSVLLYKKTDFFKTVNRSIDKLLGIKDDSPSEEKEPQPGTAEKEKEEKPPQPAEPRPENSGVASFSLLVDDVYFCQLNSLNRDSRIYKPKWMTDNEFVGTIDDSGVFTGKKVGRTNVLFKRRDDAFDEGSVMYEIDVVPTDRNWFADRLFSQMLERAPKDDVYASLILRKTLYEIPGQKIKGYDGLAEDRKLVVQFNAFDELARFAFFLRSTSEKTVEALARQLDERFEKVKLEYGKLRLWVHRDINEEHDEVDAYAYIKETKDGQLLLCIGQTWREYGELLEFQKNVLMAEKMFKECLPEVETEKIAAVLTAERNDKTPDAEETAGEKGDGPVPEETPVAEDIPEETGGPENGDDGEEGPGTVDFREPSIDEIEDFSEE